MRTDAEIALSLLDRCVKHLFWDVSQSQSASIVLSSWLTFVIANTIWLVSEQVPVSVTMQKGEQKFASIVDLFGWMHNFKFCAR